MSKKFIFELFRSKKTVFTFQDIALILNETDADLLKSKVNYYVKTGMIRALRRGVYAKPEYDTWELATHVYSPAYVSFESVLSREGVVFQYYDSIFAASYLSREIKVDNKRIVFRKIRNSILVNPEGIISNGNYSYASCERAALDALYLVKHVDFENKDKINISKLRELAGIYRSKALENRVKKVFGNG